MKNHTSLAPLEARATAAVGAELHGLDLTDPPTEGSRSRMRWRWQQGALRSGSGASMAEPLLDNTVATLEGERWVVASRYVVSAAAAAGVVIGAGTLLLQKWLPDSLSVLGNSGAMWALGALVVGVAMPSARSAAVAGAVALVCASFSYYLAADWIEGTGFTARGAVVWAAAGLAAGPVFGLAGWGARRGRHRSTAWALFGGTTVAEGIRLVWVVDNSALRPAGVVVTVIGCVVIALAVRSRQSVGLALIAVVVGAAATFLASYVVDAVFRSL